MQQKANMLDWPFNLFNLLCELELRLMILHKVGQESMD